MLVRFRGHAVALGAADSRNLDKEGRFPNRPCSVRRFGTRRSLVVIARGAHDSVPVRRIMPPAFDNRFALPVCFPRQMRTSDFGDFDEALLESSKNRNWLLVGLMISLAFHGALCGYFYRTNFMPARNLLEERIQTPTFKDGRPGSELPI